MARTSRYLRLTGAVVATVTALSVPAAAAGGESFPATVAPGTTADGVHAPQRAGAAPTRSGLDRGDALVAAAILAGALVMGFRGYVVVGAMLAGIAAVAGAGARLVTGEPKRPAWTDWPSPVATRAAKQKAWEGRPVARPKAESR